MAALRLLDLRMTLPCSVLHVFYDGVRLRPAAARLSGLPAYGAK